MMRLKSLTDLLLTTSSRVAFATKNSAPLAPAGSKSRVEVSKKMKSPVGLSVEERGEKRLKFPHLHSVRVTTWSQNVAAFLISEINFMCLFVRCGS